jgi:hypothetical protein
MMRPNQSLQPIAVHSIHLYALRARKDKRGVDLISDVLPFGRLWYGDPSAVSNAIDYAKFRSRSHDAEIRVYDEAGNMIRNARADRPATVRQLNTNIIKFPQP